MPFAQGEAPSLISALITIYSLQAYSYVSTPILGNNNPELKAKIEKAVIPLIPVGRLGFPEEVCF